MRKTPLLVACALSLTMLTPFYGQAASSLDKINQKIAQIKNQQKAAENRISEIDNQIQVIESRKTEVKQDLATIEIKLNTTQEKIQTLDRQIGDTTLKAQDAAVQLDEAEKRVEERDELLKTRVKIMYEMGNVSYLEVLLGAKDFGDFLNRLDAVKLIVDSDVKILEDNVKDKETIEIKKVEVDTHLANLEGLYAQTSQLKNELKHQQKERTVAIAQLEQQEVELEEVKLEQEQAMLDLMGQMKSALSQKNKLLQQKKYTGGRFAWPVPDSSRITSQFGLRKDPFTGKTAGHNGLDIGAPQGTTIVAAADGVVLISGYVRGYGNMISIDHGGDLSTIYGHIREGGLLVKENQVVKKGQKIAEVGSTGRSTGPHLHFGVYKGRTVVDPMGYLR
ncbi:murein hydrolase activator EnvC [Ammoniphilus sp. CFH 90114]|uniref:murein hydrolase activator EnvC family protein n=1 Tax=Ammoniphilus sp. CFH 90114 TaxID=2493665 RepID=UPI00100DF722|nr:M23 family metallopeptidase [Ammoniphilus sp. CFH 90114]RXT04016.1 metalloendopeptidase [Ammoniphilus sp. CFH 90114]